MTITLEVKQGRGNKFRWFLHDEDGRKVAMSTGSFGSASAAFDAGQRLAEADMEINGIVEREQSLWRRFLGRFAR